MEAIPIAPAYPRSRALSAARIIAPTATTVVGNAGGDRSGGGNSSSTILNAARSAAVQQRQAVFDRHIQEQLTPRSPVQPASVVNTKQSYSQRKIEEDAAALANQPIQRQQQAAALAAAEAARHTWTETQQQNDARLQKLAAAIKADPEIKRTFSSPEAIQNQQLALNSLGFTGANGQSLREDGELDLDTVVAWDKLRHNGNALGTAGSKISQAAAWDPPSDQEGTLTDVLKTFGDIEKGKLSAELLTRYTSYRQGGDTVFGIVDRTKGNPNNKFWARLNTIENRHKGAPVLRIDQADKRTNYPHINFDSRATGVADLKPHVKVPTGVFGAARTLGAFDEATRIGGKAVPFLSLLGLAADADGIYSSVQKDGGALGKNSYGEIGGLLGSYGGAAGGAKLVSIGGKALGARLGKQMSGNVIWPSAVALAAAGGFLGASAGGIGGSVLGRATGAKAGELLFEGKKPEEKYVLLETE